MPPSSKRHAVISTPVLGIGNPLAPLPLTPHLYSLHPHPNIHQTASISLSSFLFPYHPTLPLFSHTTAQVLLLLLGSRSKPGELSRVACSVWCVARSLRCVVRVTGAIARDTLAAHGTYGMRQVKGFRRGVVRSG
jgi:hypothetical protein